MREKLLRLTLLGAATGVVSAGAVLAFRWLIEHSQVLFLPGGIVGNYEALAPWAVVALPVGGGLVLGLVFERLRPDLRDVGIVHVLVQLRLGARPVLPPGNGIVQFFAGTFAIACGHSVDREGPGVHLGAVAGNLVGSRADDLDRVTLTACGAAAAIAAAFNTPLAGVVFVIEVLRLRYQIERFIAVITASVVGAVISRLYYGEAPAFAVHRLAQGALPELFLLGLLGLFTGLLAVGFVVLTEGTARFTRAWRPTLAFTLAGALTGLIGLAYPQILGVGYDTLDRILDNSLGGAVLIGLMLGKLVATAVSVGLRVPGGLIGPSLVIGGAAGGLMGVLVPRWADFATGSESFYAVIGMVSMMGAVLQAPLAALFALLELTADPDIILPGMTAVVCANVIARQVLRKESVFEHLLQLRDRPEGVADAR